MTNLYNYENFVCLRKIRNLAAYKCFTRNNLTHIMNGNKTSAFHSSLSPDSIIVQLMLLT